MHIYWVNEWGITNQSMHVKLILQSFKLKIIKNLVFQSSNKGFLNLPFSSEVYLND